MNNDRGRTPDDRSSGNHNLEPHLVGHRRGGREESRPPRREFLARLREAAELAAAAAREIARATGLTASRVLEDIHIEAAAALMRSRWKPPIWGPPG
ncbi:MAG: hypothetical protein WAN65_00355, partial [Candidatus Sulfotelmatobacter sp.]